MVRVDKEREAMRKKEKHARGGGRGKKETWGTR